MGTGVKRIFFARATSAEGISLVSSDPRSDGNDIREMTP